MQVNTTRISLTSFLAYFIMAAIITPLGVVSQPIATAYGVSITQATAVFSSLTTGIFVGAVIAIFIFDYLNIKRVVLLATLITGTGLLLIYVMDTFVALSILLFFVGLGCGLALSTAAVVITAAYTEKLRPSMLLLTDSFYSGAGTFSTLLGVYLLGLGWHWWNVYLLALGALLLLLILALPSHYPERPPQLLTADGLTKWPLAVYFCGVSLLFYLMAVVALYSWLPNYAQAMLGMEPAAAGGLVGRFFSGMFFGQLAMFFIVLRVPLKPLIFCCLLLATLITVGLWSTLHWPSIETVVALLGLISGGILKVLISYGTTLTNPPSPKMVSYLLFNTSLGTAIAPALSSWVVENSDTSGALIFATACYAIATGFLVITFLLQKPNHLAAAASA